VSATRAESLPVVQTPSLHSSPTVRLRRRDCMRRLQETPWPSRGDVATCLRSAVPSLSIPTLAERGEARPRRSGCVAQADLRSRDASAAMGAAPRASPRMRIADAVVGSAKHRRDLLPIEGFCPCTAHHLFSLEIEDLRCPPSWTAQHERA
jgi:hypothetical protein